MSNRMRALALAILVAPALGGCLFGGEARTEWAFEVTQLSAAAAAGKTGRGVTVAILDTGINVGHPAMTHLVDGDQSNGELVAYRDFVNTRQGVAIATDTDGHGTHVAGIIASLGSTFEDKIVYNGVDLRGGAPAVRLIVAKVCDASGCQGDVLADAVAWSVQQGADVLSLSLGGVADTNIFGQQLSTDFGNALQSAMNQGTVVVAAAGNGGPGTDPSEQTDDVAYPADIPGVIAVGAIQSDGRVASISSRGDDAAHACGVAQLPFQPPPRCDPNKKPELVAPGVDILSAWTGGAYARATGTSQAVPFVSATVALMLEGKADLRNSNDVAELKYALTNSAKPVVGQREPHDDAAGYGLVQAMAAIQAYA